MSSEEHEDFEEPASELAENGTNSERKMDNGMITFLRQQYIVTANSLSVKFKNICIRSIGSTNFQRMPSLKPWSEQSVASYTRVIPLPIQHEMTRTFTSLCGGS